MRKVVVDLAEAEPRTDESGQLELLLRSTCPFCGESVFLAREKDGGLATLHGSDGERGCVPFDALFFGDPKQLMEEILLRAGRDEIERFVVRTEGEDENKERLH